jgi:hypothetical protein
MAELWQNYEMMKLLKNKGCMYIKYAERVSVWMRAWRENVRTPKIDFSQQLKMVFGEILNLGQNWNLACTDEWVKEQEDYMSNGEKYSFVFESL